RERNDVRTPLHQAGQLEGGLDGVGSRGPGELKGIAPVAWLEQYALERLNERALGGCCHVEPMDDTVGLDVFHQLLLEDRIVVPIVERACASEEIDVFAPGFI